MKKLIPMILVGLLMMASVMAFNMPHPIYGTLTSDNYKVKGAEIKVENLDTGVSTYTETNEDGFYQVDLGNVDDRYREGDTIKVTLTYCENTDICSKQIAVSGGGNEVSWDLTEEVPDIEIPDSIVIVKFVCSDGTTVTTEAECPKQKVICEDGTEVEDAEECPEPEGISALYKAVIALAIIILGAFSWGAGFTGLANYYYKKGKEAEAKGHTRIAQANYDRAYKMLKTALKRNAEGYYKK